MLLPCAGIDARGIWPLWLEVLGELQAQITSFPALLIIVTYRQNLLQENLWFLMCD
jgi:hypothetical protein